MSQLDFHEVLTPRQPHRWQTIDDIEALGEAAAARAQEQHALGPAYAHRATTAVFQALMMFGTAEVLRRRHEKDRGARA